MGGSERAETLGIPADADPGQTLRQTWMEGEVSSDPLQDAPRPEATREPYLIGETLGQGGMGIVHLATQRRVGRQVAVKTLKAGRRDPGAARKLLEEAWITGRLEHPNILPIHDVDQEPDGTPFIVMKRLKGRPWTELLADEAAVRALPGGADPLEWHLRALVDVCNAVDYAHQRGFVHRDLKPDNVMIGEVGEVTLLDWGIAASIAADTDPALPRANPVRQVLGTPAYLAPEQLGSGLVIDERTDVYLLGGLLYEILHGHPPREGNLSEVLAQIGVSAPPITARGPAELVGLCARALSDDPSGRPPSAGAFREEVVRYLGHRHSDLLAQEAEAIARDLILGLSKAGVEEGWVHDRLGAARFGYRAALKAWPENQAAKEGQEAVLAAAAAWALSQGRDGVGLAWVSELGVPPPALEGAVRAARDRAQAAQALAESVDDTVGLRNRTAVIAVAGALWTINPMLFGMLEQHGYTAPSHQSQIVFTIVLSTVMWTSSFVWLGSVAQTRMNRAVAFLVPLAPTLQLLPELAGVALSIGLRETIVLHYPVWIGVAATAMVLVEWRIWPLVLGYTVAFFVTILHLKLLPLTMGASNAILTLNLLYLQWAALPPREAPR